MNARLSPVVTLAAGLATLAVFVGFSILPQVAAVYAPFQANVAVSAFQRAETVQDLAAVLGAPPNVEVLAAMDAINRLDLIAFIPAYTIFLVAAALMLGGMRSPYAWAAIAAALVGAGGDIVETSRQLAITADLSAAAEHLPLAPWHWLKYLALGANGGVIAALCLLSAKRRPVLGVIAVIPLLCMLIVYAGWLAEPRLFAGTLTLYWLALLATAFRDLALAKGAPA